MTKRTERGTADTAATRKAKGSVHAAIGKLIGDDAVCAEGEAKQAEAVAATRDNEKSPQD